jgi:DNA-binding GntR family transcriptional regulator
MLQTTSASTPPPNRRRTSITEAVRKGILDNELAPGQRLVLSDLGTMFDSTAPTIRSVLEDLAREGLVESIGGRGHRVRIATLEEALEIVEVRMAIEGFCVAKAAERITDEEILMLRSLADQLKEATDRGDIQGFATGTDRIFRAYVAISNQPVAAEILINLRARYANLMSRLTHRIGRAEVATPFWLERVEAICNRDPEAARASIIRHAKNVREAKSDLVRRNSPFSRGRFEPQGNQSGGA